MNVSTILLFFAILLNFACTIDSRISPLDMSLEAEKIRSNFPDLVAKPTWPIMPMGTTNATQILSGTAPYTYSILSGAGSISEDGVLTPMATGNIVVSVTDTNGKTASFIVDVRDVITLSAPSAFVALSSPLQVSLVGGVPPVSVAITSGGGTLDENYLFVSPAAPGTAVIAATDSLGNSSTITIKYQGLPTISAFTIAAGPYSSASVGLTFTGTNAEYWCLNFGFSFSSLCSWQTGNLPTNVVFPTGDLAKNPASVWAFTKNGLGNVSAKSNAILNFNPAFPIQPYPYIAPKMLTIDSANNLYFVTQKNTIAKYDSNLNLLFEFGGVGSMTNGQYAAPTSIAVDSLGNIYVADSRYMINKYDSSGNFLFSYGGIGTTNGKFNGIKTISLDASDNLYVLDSGNLRVEKFDSNGNFLLHVAVAGAGATQLLYGYGMVVDKTNSRVIISDALDTTGGTTVLKRYDLSGNHVSNSASLSWTYVGVSDLAVDSSGVVYANYTNNAPGGGMVKINTAGTAILSLYTYHSGSSPQFTGWFGDGTGGSPIHISGKVIDSGGNLILIFGGKIYKLSNTFTLISMRGSGSNKNTEVTLPNAIAVDSSGKIIVTESGIVRIHRFNSDGSNDLTFGGIAGTADGEFGKSSFGYAMVSSMFSSLSGMDIDSSGNIYVTDELNTKIKKFDSSGVYSAKTACAPATNCPSSWGGGLAVDSVASKVYVVDRAGKVFVYNLSLAAPSSFGSLGTGLGQLTNPNGIGLDSAGNIYVADTGNFRIQKFDSTGTSIGVFGSQGTGPGQFTTPTDVKVDSGGNIYVLDSGTSKILKFNSSFSFVSSFGSAGTGLGQFSTPKRLAIDSFGFIYVTDSFRIQKFNSAGDYVLQ